jgi:hypothetical protein
MTSFWTRPTAWAALAAVTAIVIVAAAACFVLNADAGYRARLRELSAGSAQYALLFGFAAVAAAISAHGLTYGCRKPVPPVQMRHLFRWYSVRCPVPGWRVLAPPDVR